MTLWEILKLKLLKFRYKIIFQQRNRNQFRDDEPVVRPDVEERDGLGEDGLGEDVLGEDDDRKQEKFGKQNDFVIGRFDPQQAGIGKRRADQQTQSRTSEQTGLQLRMDFRTSLLI